MRMVRMGRNGPDVSEMGLGCMGMSGGYGPADDAESIATIHAALEAGITMLDTGDFYGSGHNEMLIREALKSGKRERAFIAVKFGAMRGPDLKFLGDDGRPNSVKNFLAYTLRRLGTDHVDLYQPARLDPTVPIEDTIGAIADMVKAGYVRHIGLSEASAKSIRRAHAVHPIAALQIEYSLVSRDIEREILPTIRELGIALVARSCARSARSRARRTPRPRNSPSPGSARAARTSCRWSARAGATSSAKRWGRSRWHSRPQTSRASHKRCRPRRSPAHVICQRCSPTWTASTRGRETDDHRIISVPAPWSVSSSSSTACGTLPSRMTTPSTPASSA